MRPVALLVTGALLLAGAGAIHAQEPLSVTVDSETGAPRILVGPVLDDDALRDAVGSGLPLRLRFSVELWKDGWFDQLAAQSVWSGVLAYEPLERQYLAGDVAAAVLLPYGGYDQARASLEREWRPQILPREKGRYYYLVTLEVETLSLSDLDELERWLGGELEPAVRGGGSVTGALGTGVKRLLIRVLDLPARRFIARSGRFTLR